MSKFIKIENAVDVSAALTQLASDITASTDDTINKVLLGDFAAQAVELMSAVTLDAGQTVTVEATWQAQLKDDPIEMVKVSINDSDGTAFAVAAIGSRAAGSHSKLKPATAVTYTPAGNVTDTKTVAEAAGNKLIAMANAVGGTVGGFNGYLKAFMPYNQYRCYLVGIQYMKNKRQAISFV